MARPKFEIIYDLSKHRLKKKVEAFIEGKQNVKISYTKNKYGFLLYGYSAIIFYGGDLL